MCMVSVDDVLIKEAIATKIIDKNYTAETLSKMFEELLLERISINRKTS